MMELKLGDYIVATNDLLEAVALSRLLPTRPSPNAPLAATMPGAATLLVGDFASFSPTWASGHRAVFVGLRLSRGDRRALRSLGDLQLLIGSSDPFTHRALIACGIRTQLIGSALLTLNKHDGPRHGRLSVGVQLDRVPALPLSMDSQAPLRDAWQYAIHLLGRLSTASLVYTSEPSIALCALALGTPVVVSWRSVIASRKPERFSLLHQLGLQYDRPCLLDVTDWADRYTQFLQGTLNQAVVPVDALTPSSIRRIEAPPLAPPVRPRSGSSISRPTPSPEMQDVIQLFQSGRPGDAIDGCRAILNRGSRHPDALHVMGLCLLSLGKAHEAMRWLLQAVEQEPTRHAYRVDLAAALGQLGRFEEAAEQSSLVLREDKENVAAWQNLALARQSLSQFDGAAEAYRAAIALRPESPLLHQHLGEALRREGRMSEASEAFLASLRLDPHHASAWAGMASALEESARAESAIDCYRQVTDLMPASAVAGSNLLVALHYPDSVPPEELWQEHLRWARRHAPIAERANAEWPGRDRGANRRLRIGYVSPDFKTHPAPRFFSALLANHSPEAVAVHCYCDVPAKLQDAVTHELRGFPVAWREIAGLADEQAERMIRADEIDILVDLAGHMSNSRLTLFARRPAPIQVTYVGYPSTTGLAAMDFRFTDSIQDPPGVTDRWHSERLVRLNPCCWCYRPDADSPEVVPLPALKNAGALTFASFNRLAKVSPTVLRVWRSVLEALPAARLQVLVPSRAGTDPAFLELLAGNGIDTTRVELLGRRTREAYMKLWADVDLALDTFPYNGMTTTCDALWMGVPTVTMAGPTHVSRVGSSLLHAVGLGELVARDEEEWIAIVRRFAANSLESLSALRMGLRDRMRGSIVCDGPRLARRVEEAFRTMWCSWSMLNQ